MIRAIKIRNLTDSDVHLETNEGNRRVPARGTLSISPSEYLAFVAENDIGALGLDVKMRDINMKNVSVKDFGAKGDGFNDDTYAIQSAIDYVGDNGGGIVNLPIGVYLVSGISITSNVSFVGESKTESVLKSRHTLDTSILSIESANASIKSMRVVM